MMEKMWGGRFSKKTDPDVERFTSSIHFDKKLAKYDCIGSLYHAGILAKAGIIPPVEAKKIKKGLEDILEEINSGRFEVTEETEDIHTYIQNLLEKKIGKAALKLHTARSRNEQIVFDVKCYCRDTILNTNELILGFKKNILNFAKKNKKIIIPGYTHLQHAQPAKLMDYLFAYLEMLDRDYKRLTQIFDRIELTLGAGALTGTPLERRLYNIKVKELTEEAKIKVSDNPIDTVSDRDFVIEILNALAILGMHLSRLAEDLIIWSTREFGFIDIDERFCTGSSLMPQKKNPDCLELIRGHAGRLYGNLISVLVVMKGLPLTYNRDMQLDKEPLFDSFSIIQDELKILTKLIPSIKINKENIEKQLLDESLYATDLAHRLVEKGLPFREAHRIVGNLIRYSLKYKPIREMSQKDLNRFSKKLNAEEIKRIFQPQESVRTKRSYNRRRYARI